MESIRQKKYKIMQPDTLKSRTLALTNVVTADEKDALLKFIQAQAGVLNCTIDRNKLILQYDLKQTSLDTLLPGIRTELEASGINLEDNMIQRLQTAFICFIETNQLDNINRPSGWHLRLQNIYLGQASRTDHARKHQDIKKAH